MSTASAHLDPIDLLGARQRMGRPRMRPLVVASVDDRTPLLQGLDWIRVDVARLELDRASVARRRFEQPALLDVPGPRTRRSGWALTTGEFLAYAMAEEFEWVNLRGATRLRDVERARRLLSDSVRVTVGVASLVALRHCLEHLGAAVDGIVLDCAAIERRLGRRRARDAERVAMLAAVTGGKPCFVSGGLLPAVLHTPRADDAEVGRLAALVEDGCAGFVLDPASMAGGDPQTCVDALRLIADHAASTYDGPGAGRQSAAARVGGPSSTVSGEHLDFDKPGI